MQTQSIQPDLSFIRNVMQSGGDTVKRCYQCATCSVVCPLSTDESPFPRKEMLWTQWGLAGKVAGDVDVWLCHQCGDCTAYCPRDARPGDVLSAIRLNAIRYYAEPKFLADMFSSPTGVIGAVFLGILLVLAVAGVWSGLVSHHAFPFPEEMPIEYHNFMSVIPIDILFLSTVAFVLYVLYNGVKNFWMDISAGANLPKSYSGTYPVPPMGTLITGYIIPAVKEIIEHSRFKKCGQTADRATGHLYLVVSFIILFIVTNYVFIAEDLFHAALNLIGPVTPMPQWHPVKLAANIGGIMLIVGVFMIKGVRDRLTEKGTLKSSDQDWILIWLIFAVGATGMCSEIFRLTQIKQLAYPVYILHLACVWVLFLSLPFSKFGHLVYRSTAYVFERWAADVKSGKAGFGMEKSVGSEH